MEVGLAPTWIDSTAIEKRTHPTIIVWPTEKKERMRGGHVAAKGGGASSDTRVRRWVDGLSTRVLYSPQNGGFTR